MASPLLSELLKKPTRLSFNFCARKTVILFVDIITLCAIINLLAPASSKRLAKMLYKLILALCLIWGLSFKSLNFLLSYIKHVKS